MAYIPQPPPIPRNRDMAFYEERERMRKLAQKLPVNMGNSGDMGFSGERGTSGYSGYPLTGSTLDTNVFSGSTKYQETSIEPEKEKPKKIKPNIQPIISEREKVKTSWKFWKK